MTTFSVFDQGVAASDERVLRAAVAAHLGRYRGESRLHTGSDLKVFLAWCARAGLDPLDVGRVEIERYVRWLQEIRCYQPVDGVAPVVGRGRLPPGLRHRPDPGPLAGRLRHAIALYEHDCAGGREVARRRGRLVPA